ncbi:biotin/lipoyl-containing protein [Desulfopila sp. IMCC35008]|uniref:biotin/lipoyl-containing protein n=1 Tax=Desulfopila sp. IMCC35008 TaxID=2653858 RepID=UPI0013D5E15E|nr:biotin/lipoyl-containing protein [Desulfopila sp. IMCC35008]
MRMFRVVVGGNEYEVGIEEITEDAGSAPAPVAKPAAAPSAKPTPSAPRAAAPKPSAPTPAAGEGTIAAAMPGTINDVKVGVGDTVKRGDTVLILEAMKMENEIKSPIDGIVSSIEVEKGASVNAGMTLMVIG